MESKFSHLPDIKTIQPDRLIKYRVSEDKFSAEVLLPGLSYTDFDQKIGGKMNLWSMAKLFECIRYAVLPYGFGHFDRLKDDEHSIFMASTAYHISEYGNTLNTRPHWGLNFPMYTTLDIIYSGSSAFCFEIKLTNYENKKLLMSARMTFVYIDYKTRKPAPFPGWYIEAKKLKSFGPALPRLATPEIPGNAFQYEVTSCYSDIDHNGHVNQSIYVKWCTDAGTEAALKGLYSGFTENIGKYPLDNLEIKYIGEGFVEENFVINTWQDKVSPLILHFAITKQGELTIVAKFSYKTADIGARL
ncbi:uncharacterized protein LOC132744969 isoform X6 [Ruditapes philippinarum]|uniref:uncharacterized protein LOC132744969 isoform X6 n=1 Tax=Ruditapes philippinarum TaxID=129788 RepID=UPI00295AC373|nr:uncharacterized protein LOC132744969 isoform X6 [Ruditapes philippinarum]